MKAKKQYKKSIEQWMRRKHKTAQVLNDAGVFVENAVCTNDMPVLKEQIYWCDIDYGGNRNELS